MLLEQHRDHDLAEIGYLQAGKLLMDEWTEDKKGIPYFDEETFKKDRFFVFQRVAEGTYACEIHDAGAHLDTEILRLLGETYAGVIGFTVVNLGALLRHVLTRMLNVQIEIAEKAGEAHK